MEAPSMLTCWEEILNKNTLGIFSPSGEFHVSCIFQCACSYSASRLLVRSMLSVGLGLLCFSNYLLYFWAMLQNFTYCAPIILHCALLCYISSLGHHLFESCFSSAACICFSHTHFSRLLTISGLNFNFLRNFYSL